MCTVQRDAYVFKFCSSSSYPIFTVWLLHCIHLEYAVKPNLEQHSFQSQHSYLCKYIVCDDSSHLQFLMARGDGGLALEAEAGATSGHPTPTHLTPNSKYSCSLWLQSIFHQHPAKESISQTIAKMNSIHLYLLFHFCHLSYKVM